MAGLIDVSPESLESTVKRLPGMSKSGKLTQNQPPMRPPGRRIQNQPKRPPAQLINLTKRPAKRVSVNPSVKSLKKNSKKDYPASEFTRISETSMDLTAAITAFADLSSVSGAISQYRFAEWNVCPATPHHVYVVTTRSTRYCATMKFQFSSQVRPEYP